MSLSKPQKRRFMTQDTLIRIAGSSFEYSKSGNSPNECQLVPFLLRGKRSHAAVASLLKPCKFAEILAWNKATIHREEESEVRLVLSRAEFEAFTALDMMPKMDSVRFRGYRITVDNIILKGLTKLTLEWCGTEDHTHDQMYQMIMQNRETLKELKFPPLATFRRLPPMSLQTLGLCELPQSNEEQVKLLSSFTFERFEWDYHETEQMPPQTAFSLPIKHLKIVGEAESFVPPAGATNSQLRSFVMESIDLSTALAIGTTVLLERIEKAFPNLQECRFIVDDDYQECPCERSLFDCIEKIDSTEELLKSFLPSFQTEFRIRVKLPVGTRFNPKEPITAEGVVLDRQSEDLAKTGVGEQVLKRSLTLGPRTSFTVEITLDFNSMWCDHSDAESSGSEFDDFDHSELDSASSGSEDLEAMDTSHDPSDVE